MSSTATTAGLQKTAPDIEAMAAILSNAPRVDEWTLIAPNGRVWITNKPEELFAVLAPHHPLLKATKEQP